VAEGKTSGKCAVAFSTFPERKKTQTFPPGKSGKKREKKGMTALPPPPPKRTEGGFFFSFMKKGGEKRRGEKSIGPRRRGKRGGVQL